MMKRVDIRPIQRDPIQRAELKARYWGGRVGELSLGDVLLAGPRAVALLEFKREANWEGRWKEQQTVENRGCTGASQVREPAGHLKADTFLRRNQ